MKKLDSTKLTDEQIEFFKGHLQYLEKTKAHAYENLKNGSKAAVVVADVPSHTNVRIKGTAHIHEDDDYQKKIAPTAYVVDIDIEEIYE